MRVCILGPLLIESDGGPIPLSGRRRQTLLARLVVQRNEAVSVAALIDDVWLGDAPPGAPSTLKSHLSHLRTILGPGRIRGSGGSVVLRLDDSELDAAIYEAGLTRAASAAAEGRWEEAHGQLSAGRGLWRGQPLVEVSSAPWALAETNRLVELDALGRELLLECYLALGRADRVVAAAERLLADHPYRERVCAHLMLALYRTGRQVEALRVYARIRNRLIEELGVEPGPELTAMEDAILRHDRHLDPARSPSGPFDDSPRPPLPSALEHRPGEVIVGRRRELDLGRKAYDRARDGGPAVLLVSGEVGIGKTALLGEVCRQAHADGSVVLFGRGEEDLAAPYHLFRQVFAHHAAHAPQDLAALVPSDGMGANPLLPLEVAEARPDHRGGGMDPDSERYLVVDSAARALSDMSRDRVVVLALDDLQWADPASLATLRHALTALDRSRLLVVATIRAGVGDADQRLADVLAAAHRTGRCIEMELSGLQAGDVAELMEATAPPGRHGPTIETATTITRDTAGNPLFVCELLRHLAEEHVSYPLGRPDRTRSPVGIRRVVSARVEHLGPGAVTALGAASVCGAEFSIELVTRASGLDKSAVTSLFESAEAARLLAEGGGPGRFVFCHETVRHTLYEDMGGARRAELHADVARLLEEQLLAAPTAGRASSPGQAAGIARHWVASATPEGRSRAVPWLIRAGRDAAASLDPHSARTHFSDALALADGSVSFDETERIDALIGLGTAERQVGEPGFRATLMSAARSARQIGDRRRAVACGLALDRGFVAALGASDPELLGLLEEAREALGDDDPERPVVLAALCQELSFATGLGARRQLGEEAIALADRHGDPAVRARVRIATGYPLLVPEMVDDCRRRSAEAMALAQDLSDPMLEFWAASRRFTTMGLVGDVEEMDRCLAVSGRCASRLDQPVPTWMQGVHEAGRMLLAGDAAGGERRTNEAFAVASSAGQTDALVLLGGQLLLVHWIRGTVSTVAPFAEQMADANPGLPVLQAVKAVVFSDVGRTSEVQELLTRLAEDEYQLPRDPTWLLAMCAYAEAVATCRLVEHAKHLFDELAPWSHLSAFADPVGIGPVSHYLGGLAALLDRVEEADHFLAASAQWCRRVEAPFFAARTDLVWGRLWADHPGPGSATRARDLLDRAIHTSRKHGCAGLVGQADAALARIER